jgi:hypothetical protein
MRFALSAVVIHALDEEDLFTRAPIEHTIENMDRILVPGAVDVHELRTTSRMMGLREARKWIEKTANAAGKRRKSGCILLGLSERQPTSWGLPQ